MKYFLSPDHNYALLLFDRFACGKVLKSVLCTEGGKTGVDAAVVTVSGDMSICAVWPSHTLDQLVETGTLLHNHNQIFD